MKSLAERLRNARMQKGLNQSQLARQAHTVPQVIQLIEAGKVLQSKHIFAIADVLGVTAEWLLMGKVGSIPMRAHTLMYLEDKATGGKKYDSVEIPIITAAAQKNSGETTVFHLNPQEIIGHVMPHPRQQGMHGAFAFYCVGDGMAPRYENGDLLYCLPNQPLKSGQDIVILLLNDQQAMLQRLVKQDRATQKLTCEQFNPPARHNISQKEIIEVFTVVGRG